MANAKKHSITLYARAADFIRARGEVSPGDNMSAVINASLERYAAVLAAGRRRLMETFEESEMGLIIDALNNPMFRDPKSIALISQSIEDAIDMDNAATKWNVDDAALTDKLAGLSYAEQVALVDAIERYWLDDEPSGDFLDALRR